MEKRVKTQPCPECGGLMRYEKHDDVLEYKGHKRTIETLGFWCTQCGEAILTGKPLLAREKAFLQFKAEVDGVLAPPDVKRIREMLGLSQRRAGEILGGGPRAFQKYESGEQSVSLPMSNLLRLLEKDPTRLRELLGSAHTSARTRSPRGVGAGKLSRSQTPRKPSLGTSKAPARSRGARAH